MGAGSSNVTLDDLDDLDDLEDLRMAGDCQLSTTALVLATDSVSITLAATSVDGVDVASDMHQIVNDVAMVARSVLGSTITSMTRAASITMTRTVVPLTAFGTATA